MFGNKGDRAKRRIYRLAELFASLAAQHTIDRKSGRLTLAAARNQFNLLGSAPPSMQLNKRELP